MVGEDKDFIHRCFDIKGSLQGRYEKVSPKKLKEGTGLLTLKDKNMIMLNKVRQVFDVDEDSRNEIMEQMEKDSKFLCDQNFIDYSIFLIQVCKDNNHKLVDEEEFLPMLTYDKQS